jgi:hypothetical protein
MQACVLRTKEACVRTNISSFSRMFSGVCITFFNGINWIIQHILKENTLRHSSVEVKLWGPIKRFRFRPLLIIIDSENLVPRRSSGHVIDKKQSSEMDPHVEKLEHVGHGKDVGNPCSLNVRYTIKVETQTRKASLLILKFGSSSMACKISGFISKTWSRLGRPIS